MTDNTSQPKRYSFKVWALVSLLIAFMLGWLGLVVLLYLKSEHHAEHAFDAGRVVHINVQSGEVDGHVTMNTLREDDSRSYREQRRQELMQKFAIKADDKVEEVASESAITAPATTTTTTVEQIMAEPAISVAVEEILSVVEHEGQEALNPAPYEKLIELMPSGSELPRISDDGEIVPWRYYAKPEKVKPDARLLSIVVTNIGLNTLVTQDILSLDTRLTLGFSPYAQQIERQVAVSRMSGFEAWMMLPLQHQDYPVNDYGPLSLLVEEEVEGNINQLQHVLSTASGVVGLLALPDEQFSREGQMLSLFDALTERGILLALHEKRFSPSSNKSMLRYTDMHIDGSNMPGSVEQLFGQIESTIESEGHVIVTMAAMPGVLSRLDTWIGTLPSNNIQLVPLSAQYRK